MIELPFLLFTPRENNLPDRQEMQKDLWSVAKCKQYSSLLGVTLRTVEGCNINVWSPQSKCTSTVTMKRSFGMSSESRDIEAASTIEEISSRS